MTLRQVLRSLATAVLVTAVAIPGAPARAAPPVPDAPTVTRMRPVASDAATLAKRLTAAQRTARDPDSTQDEVAAAALVTQVAYRQLGRRPAWIDTVVAKVPRGLRAIVRENIAARREFVAMAPKKPAKKLPAWRIIDPIAAGTLRGYYAAAEKRFDVGWEVLAAVHLVETGLGRIVGRSSAGAKGPMQFMPGTWRAYGLGGDVWDAEDAIMGAANYLASNGAAEGTARGLRKALRRYNNSAHYVRGVRHYANLIDGDPLAYREFHAWRIFYRTRIGELLLPTGYSERRPVPLPARKDS